MPRHFVGIVERQIEQLIKLGYHQVANKSELAFRETFNALLVDAARWMYDHDTSVRVLVIIPQTMVPLAHQLSKIWAPAPDHQTRNRPNSNTAHYGRGAIADGHLSKFTEEAQQPYLIFDTDISRSGEDVGKLVTDIKTELAEHGRRVLTPVELTALATHYPHKMSAGHFDFLGGDGKEMFFCSGTWELLAGSPIFHELRKNFVYATCRKT
ncbi:MAG: hypothetical protein V1902_01130 [Candidatus Falkowbacteria bacterium]